MRATTFFYTCCTWLLISLLIIQPTYAQQPDAVDSFVEEYIENPIVKDAAESVIDSSHFNKSHFKIEPIIAEKYTGEDWAFQEKEVSESFFTRLQNWFRNFLKKLFRLADGPSSDLLLSIIEFGFYAIVCILVIFFIVRAYRNNAFRNPVAHQSNSLDEQVESIEAVMKEDNFQQRIQQAVQEQDYRMAIRYYFIWSLKSLKEKGIIEFSSEKSAEDYVIEIQDAPTKSAYSYASYLYTYIWYGNFEIDAQQYATYEPIFIKLIQLGQNR